MCGTNAVFEGESLASYGAFVRHAVELRAEPEWLDRESPAPRTGTWGRAPTVKVWKEGDPLFELRGPHGDEPARVRIAVTQTVATRGMPNECPLTFRGVRGVDPLPVGGGEGSGTDDGGFRYVNNYWLDATHLEALASARRLRLRNCLGDIPLGDDTRAALGAMTERLEVLERTAGPE